MNSQAIRELFTDFFAERGHRRVPSSSLIPPPDERTLLFTNAGMNQMKPYFMAMAEPPARRMTSVQKCFRTSDIEEVGDNSHCTFFEMLGNFSVGDYFKAEVIPWAWQLLTDPEPKGMGLDKTKIWTTVYLDDDEAYDLWRSVGIPAERIVRFDESENYWFMIKGGAGPCGPNSEIYYDFGPEIGCGRPDCSPPTHDCGRFLEIWNLVFMDQYQEEDGKTRRPLPQKNVDTGAGLERWAPVYMWQNMVDWQGNPKRWAEPPSIYDTDLFRPIIARIEELTGLDYDTASDEQRRAIRVVAEHTRAATFLIADGVTPANDGRGYVLRRLIRRGTSFGQRLKPGAEFLESTARGVIGLMASEHENLRTQGEFVLKTLRSEETRFFETLLQGRSQLEDLEARHASDKKVSGAEVFQLWDTYGFPPELTQEMLAEDGYTVADPESFEALMQEQRERSRAATKFEGDSERIQTYAELGLHPTEFVGYDTTRSFASVASILLDGNTIVRELTPALNGGHRVEVTLDHTPFYAEGGGQVGDRGEIVWPGGRFVVEDTQNVGEGGVVAHLGHLESGTLTVGDPVEARVDESRRGDTMRNHTATHILHGALRKVIGTHVRQAGSLVTPDRLRFDFTHLEALTPEQIREVEALANSVVRENLTVHVEHKSYEEALADGALAFFGDKYADVVRVVGVCDIELHDCFSHELCGGTHVHASGEVGAIIVTAETSIGAGLRRIEAVTGRAAAERIRSHEDTLNRLSAGLRVPVNEIEGRLTAMREENDRLRKQVEAMERRLARGEADSFAADATQVDGVNVVVTRVPDPSSGDALREIGDGLKSKLGTSVILLGSVIDGRPVFIAMS
ncbi:MAG TPA: alanine--tRNA ligase, partial [Dehalococcoidia bacterium]|nr:alanine--tRNA ligase [Dehalococcoidia bacterium]